ncbi:MAG: type II toxin-antitoxin system RelE/ParE family toxin [Gemmatimonadota bacterium]
MILSFKDRGYRGHLRWHRLQGCPEDVGVRTSRACLQNPRPTERGRVSGLPVLPGLRLEKLKGNRTGLHSIRINDQYRVCFRWTEMGPEDVKIVDYRLSCSE